MIFRIFKNIKKIMCACMCERDNRKVSAAGTERVRLRAVNKAAGICRGPWRALCAEQFQ